MTKKKLVQLKKPVDKDLVTILESALEQAKSGEIIGLVLLINRAGDEYQHAAAGDMAMSEAVNTFRSWEFDQRMMAWRAMK